MEKRKYKIFYIGLHPDTLVFLSKEPSLIVYGASFLEYLLFFKTLNPVNYIFKLIYFFRVKNECRLLELILMNVFSIFSFLSSSTAYKYKDYIKVLSKKGIRVLDVDKIREAEDYIKMNKLDLNVVNSWSLLPNRIVFAPNKGSLNIHPSKLPQYRGSVPTLWSLKNNDKKTAVTYIILDKSIDGGNILSQCEVEISKNDDAISLENKIKNVIEETLCADIIGYLDGTIIPYVQNLAQSSSTAKYEEYRFIDWREEKARDIFNKIKLYPFIEPMLYCFTFFKGKKIEIKNAVSYEVGNKLNIKAGEFIKIFPNIFIGASDGMLRVRLFSNLSFRDSIMMMVNKNKKFN